MMYDIKDFTKEFKVYNTVEFKKLENYDNYFIYEDGRIISIKRNIFLKPGNINGYQNVNLYNNNGKNKNYLVHRLIYETFIGPIPEKYEVDHFNGIRDDNRISNLRLLTPKENLQNKHHLERYKQISKNLYNNHKETFKEYYRSNTLKIKEQQKKYYNNNKERIKEYYDQNKEKIKEYQKEYREKHKEYQKEYQKKYRENKKKDI